MKINKLILFILLLLPFISEAQKYDKPNNWGISWKRGQFDTLLYTPFIDTTFNNINGNRPGALSVRKQDSSLYLYNGLNWTKVISTKDSGYIRAIAGSSSGPIGFGDVVNVNKVSNTTPQVSNVGSINFADPLSLGIDAINNGGVAVFRAASYGSTAAFRTFLAGGTYASPTYPTTSQQGIFNCHLWTGKADGINGFNVAGLFGFEIKDTVDSTRTPVQFKVAQNLRNSRLNATKVLRIDGDGNTNLLGINIATKVDSSNNLPNIKIRSDSILLVNNTNDTINISPDQISGYSHVDHHFSLNGGALSFNNDYSNSTYGNHNYMIAIEGKNALGGDYDVDGNGNTIGVQSFYTTDTNGSSAITELKQNANVATNTGEHHTYYMPRSTDDTLATKGQITLNNAVQNGNITPKSVYISNLDSTITWSDTGSAVNIIDTLNRANFRLMGLEGHMAMFGGYRGTWSNKTPMFKKGFIFEISAHGYTGAKIKTLNGFRLAADLNFSADEDWDSTHTGTIFNILLHSRGTDSLFTAFSVNSLGQAVCGYYKSTYTLNGSLGNKLLVWDPADSLFKVIDATSYYDNTKGLNDIIGTDTIKRQFNNAIFQNSSPAYPSNLTNLGLQRTRGLYHNDTSNMFMYVSDARFTGAHNFIRYIARYGNGNTALPNSTAMFQLQVSGMDGSSTNEVLGGGWTYLTGASTWSSTNHGLGMIYISASDGTTSTLERFGVHSDGNVYLSGASGNTIVGSTTTLSSDKLQVNGTVYAKYGQSGTLTDSVLVNHNGTISTVPSWSANVDSVASGNTSIVATNRTIYYTFTGSTATWTLPTIATANHGTYKIMNTGSGNLTISSNAGGNDLYYQGVASSTFTISSGQSYTIHNNGTLFFIGN